MSMMSVGDMALSFQMRKQNAQLKQQMVERNQEVITGHAYDLGKRVTGDFMSLAAVDRSLDMLDAYDTAVTEAEVFATASQAALGVVTDVAQDIAPLLVSSVTNASSNSQDTLARDAREKLGTVVSALNTQIAGRFAFAGVDTGNKPLVDVDTLLSQAATAAGGATDAATLITAISDWFDAPAGGGGFVDTAYGGSETPLASFRIGPGEEARLEVTAADQPIRDTLKGLVLASLIDEGVVPLDVQARREVAMTAGTTILGADSGVIGLRADLGTTEAKIAEAQTRNSAERAALEIARLGQISVDPYDTATALQALQTQMESLYTLTARISRLSFADFMR